MDVQYGLRARLDRQRPADSASIERCRRRRADRHHGRVDHRHPPIGSASAAYLGGVLRIAFGTYIEAFMMSGMLLIAAAIMVLFIGAGRSSREPETVATATL